MEPLGATIGILIATVLIVVAAHFAWRQRQTLRLIHSNPAMSADQRRFLLRQCARRAVGSLLSFLLAGLLIGALFLDFDPWQMSPENEPQVDRETARQAARFLGVYVMSMLLVLFAIVVLAMLDFWATARYSLQQQKRLIQEHREQLEADLLQYRQRADDA